jgi:hypothetical protein
MSILNKSTSIQSVHEHAENKVHSINRMHHKNRKKKCKSMYKHKNNLSNRNRFCIPPSPPKNLGKKEIEKEKEKKKHVFLPVTKHE